MKNTSFDPRRFRSTVPFYTRYRLSYPARLITRVAQVTGLVPGDRVLDLGCGPGLLAIAFAQAGMRVIAIDPEPDMLNAAQEAARAAGVELDLRQGSSFALPRDLREVKLVTIGRAFHWMDRRQILRDLDQVVGPEGAIALFGDDHPKTAENVWRLKLREICDRYGRGAMAHVRDAADPGF